MSVVFGVAEPCRQIGVCSLTDTIRVAMSRRDWFVADSFVDHEHNLAIGRIGIGIFDKALQPVRNSMSGDDLVTKEAPA